MTKSIGYFIETQIFSGNIELPPRKTRILLIGDKPSFDLDAYTDNDEVPVLSVEGNWYSIKKKDIVLEKGVQ